MRNIIYILLFTIVYFIPNTTLGQQAKQIDYFKTLSLNLSDLNDYLLKFDFEYSGHKSDKIGDENSWAYLRNKQGTGKANKFYTLFENHNGTKSISFQSTDKSDYFRFKKIIKSQIPFLKTKNIDDALVEYYLNSKYDSRIWIFLGDNGKTVYEMTLELR